jgi:translation initiation factor 6 (eIF-6)
MGRIHTLYDITAIKVPSTAVGNLSSTNVQDALAELDTEKEAAGTATATLSAHLAAYDHANIPTAAQKGALVGTDGVPSAANPFVTNSDPRLSGTPSGGGGGVTVHKLFALMGA